LGNAMLLVLNLPLIGIWVRIVMIPYVFLFPLILFFCLVGAYSVNNSIGDVFLMLICGLFGYLMKKFEYDAAPLLLGFILGPLLETTLRQSLIMSEGEFSIFLQKPICLIALVITALLVITAVLPLFKSRRSGVVVK
jgi:putative tricarboxylic transport membrane protein